MSRVLRLRPVVHASPTGAGLHLRGWTSSVTIGGGSALWNVWQRIEPSLVDGVTAAGLAPPEGASPGLAKAIEVIVAQLHEHDMLVPVPVWAAPAPSEDTALWLLAMADDPGAAWAKLVAARFVVSGSGPVAAAATRSLRSIGLSVAREALSGVDTSALWPDPVVVRVGETAVAVGLHGESGFVLPPRPPSSVDVGPVAERFAARHADETGLPLPEVVAALLGSAAAHRAVTAAAGMPDPGTPPDAPAPVLVVRCDPLSATYRPLPRAETPWQVADALGDPDFGLLPPVLEGDLPQVPACLARSGDVVGFGTTAAAALLDTALRSVARDLGVAVGHGERHAVGVALRQALHTASHLSGLVLPATAWSSDATARRWWKALTLRFAVPAEVVVTRFGANVVHASITADGVEIAWAVEATAADAVAFAALSAVAGAQGGAEVLTFPASGAAPEPPPDAPVSRTWHWPVGVGAAEELLQGELEALVGPAVPVGLGEWESVGLVGMTVPSAVAVKAGDRR